MEDDNFDSMTTEDLFKYFKVKPCFEVVNEPPTFGFSISLQNDISVILLTKEEISETGTLVILDSHGNFLTRKFLSGRSDQVNTNDFLEALNWASRYTE